MGGECPHWLAVRSFLALRCAISRSDPTLHSDMDHWLEAVAQQFAENRPLIPMYIHLIVSAVFPIYAGAHASLSRPSSAAAPTRKTREQAVIDGDEDEEAEQKMEGLSPRDAVVFPLTAAAVLTGLYFLIKRFGADPINLILGWYFAAVGVYSVGRLINDASNFILGFVLPGYFAHHGTLYKVDDQQRRAVAVGGPVDALGPPIALLGLPHAISDTLWEVRAFLKQKYTTKAYLHEVVDLKANLTRVNVGSALLGGLAIAYSTLIAKPWWLTNLQGFAVCYNAMQFMSPTTFTTGSLILGGLFVYDIWAVFFTPLMVTVAKNLDVPIKLVFPRPDEPSPTAGKPPIKSFSMLGLGDIVLPGIMIGLALRFDLYMFYLRKQKRRRVEGDTSESGCHNDHVEKATYVSASSNFGDRLWTWPLPPSSKPEKLKFSFPKPYFIASMVGYMMGMIATLIIMSVYHHAQPALLYLVPGVLTSLWSTGWLRGELSHMWEFSEAVTGEQVEGDKHVSKNVQTADELSWWQSLKDEIFGKSEGDRSVGDKKDDKKKVAKGNAAGNSAKEENGLVFAFSVSRYQRKATENQPNLDAIKA